MSGTQSNLVLMYSSSTPAALEIVRLMGCCAVRVYVDWGGQKGGKQLQ
jgi:hypothetical protein